MEITYMMAGALVAAGLYITQLHYKVSEQEEIIISLLDQMGAFDVFKEEE